MSIKNDDKEKRKPALLLWRGTLICSWSDVIYHKELLVIIGLFTQPRITGVKNTAVKLF